MATSRSHTPQAGPHSAGHVPLQRYLTGDVPFGSDGGHGIEHAVRPAGIDRRPAVAVDRLEEAGVSASVITRTDLAQRQFPAVADILREVPGCALA